MSGLNAWTYLYVSLTIMPVISFLSFSQPYVLTEIIGIPAERHGQVTGLLMTIHEIVVLALISFAGGLSDRVGRRPIYAAGTLITALGFALYGLAHHHRRPLCRTLRLCHWPGLRRRDDGGHRSRLSRPNSHAASWPALPAYSTAWVSASPR